MKRLDDKNNQIHKKFKLPLKSYLMYLLLATFLVTTVSMAKYTTTATGEANAIVAHPYFVNDNYNSEELIVINLTGSTENYQFSVTNKDGTNISDVSLDYTITVTTTNNLPLNISWYNITDSIDGTSSITGDASGISKQAKISGNLLAGVEDTHIINLFVSWNSSYKDYQLSYEIDCLTVSIHWTQTGGE